MPARNPHQLTQEDIDMLANRRALDQKFEDFMTRSLADRADITNRVGRLEADVKVNTDMTKEVHTALFAKDASNKFEQPGIMVSIDKILNHVKVMCNIAKFLKWLAVSALAAGMSFVVFFGDVKAFLVALKALL